MGMAATQAAQSRRLSSVKALPASAILVFNTVKIAMITFPVRLVILSLTGILQVWPVRPTVLQFLSAQSARSSAIPSIVQDATMVFLSTMEPINAFKSVETE